MDPTTIDLEAVTYSVIDEPNSSRATFLMCPPHLYDVDYVINPWMAGNVHAASRELATVQWEELYQTLSALANVVLVEPQPGSPDMVFTANAGLVFKHPTGGRQVAISSFFHPERQDEEEHFRRWFLKNGFPVLDLPREMPFEGEGDALFSEDGARLWIAFGQRTVAESHDVLRATWPLGAAGPEVVALELVDPRFYHLDTCFAPLTRGFAMYFPAAFSAESVRAIEAYYPPEKRIIVAERDAVRFACNAVNVEDTIILNCISTELCGTLEARGFDVIQIDLSEFMRAGGAAKCLVMKLPG